jgi:hypothetical protein
MRSIARAGRLSWSREYPPGRQDGRDGLLARGGQPRHQQRRQSEADWQAHLQPAVLAAASQSLHTVLPLWDRNILFAASEASAEREAWFRENTEVIDFFAPARTTSYAAANPPT